MDDEPILFDVADHWRWEDFKAYLLWRNDMERKANGLPPLENEIAEDFRRIDAAVAEENSRQVLLAA